MKHLGKALAILLLLIETCIAQVPEIQLHEAFINRNTSLIPLIPAPRPPPKPISEPVPPQVDMNTQWIPGYWDWEENTGQYEWICGVWRRPPPDQEWIAGSWIPAEGGWIRLRGFWNMLTLKEQRYIPIPPPDPVQEDPGLAPSPNTFWTPGYWEYSDEKYQWFSGKWQSFNPDWVLVPAHYIWRLQGFIFIPAYWDWPIERVGTSYSCTGPVTIQDPAMILHSYLVQYPDYLHYYCHHFHYHPEFWQECACFPPWWNWQSWWCLNWQNQWAVWWWYGHPGYPAPIWMNESIAKALPPPTPQITQIFQNKRPPLFITPQGITSPNQWFKANQKVSGKHGLVIPKGQAQKVLNAVTQNLQQNEKIFEPSGKIASKTAPKLQFPSHIKPASRLKIPAVPPKSTQNQPVLEPKKKFPDFQPVKEGPQNKFRPVYPQVEEQGLPSSVQDKFPQKPTPAVSPNSKPPTQDLQNPPIPVNPNVSKPPQITTPEAPTRKEIPVQKLQIPANQDLRRQEQSQPAVVPMQKEIPGQKIQIPAISNPEIPKQGPSIPPPPPKPGPQVPSSSPSGSNAKNRQ